MQSLNISIPKPCHEDWSKMTVEERGRFCGKCSKTVFDFSDKTNNEILQYVSTHQNEKLCGHFRNDQLNQPITIHLQVPAPYRMSSPLHAFAIAALLAFGTSLFSCTTPGGKTVGEIQVIPSDIPEIKVTADNENLVLGGISFCEPPAPTEEHIKGDTIVTQSLKGKIKIQRDTLFKTLPEVEIESATVPLVCSVTTGAIAIAINETNAIVPPDTESIAAAGNKKEELLTSPDDFNTVIYPNPTDGLLHIDINAGKEEFAEIDLHDLAGKYVRKLFTKQIVQPGRNSIQLNIIGEPPGIYLLRIIIGNKTKTEKVVLEKR
jgi:hypothetical protein